MLALYLAPEKPCTASIAVPIATVHTFHFFVTYQRFITSLATQILGYDEIPGIEPI